MGRVGELLRVGVVPLGGVSTVFVALVWLGFLVRMSIRSR